MATTPLYNQPLPPQPPTVPGVPKPTTVQKPRTAAPVVPGMSVQQAAPRPSFGAGPAQPKTSFSAALGRVPSPNQQAATAAIGRQLAPAAPGPSASGQIARASFDRGLQAEKQAILDQSARMGRVGTGQILGDQIQHLEQRVLPARQTFGAQLQVQEEGQQQARQQLGIQNTLTREQIQSGERIAGRQIEEQKAGRLSNERIANKELAQNAQQFQSKQDFNTWAAEQGWDQDAIARAWEGSENEKARLSGEKIAFADLDIQSRSLAQDAMQFSDKIEFDKWAVGKGLEADEANRIWESAENQKQREFTGEESALGRGLQRYIADKGFDISADELAENIRQFDSKLDFDEWATTQGFSENEKDRIHGLRIQDIQNSFARGERLGAEDHSILIEDKRIAHDGLMQERDELLDLKVLDKQQAHDTLMQTVRNDYEDYRQQSGFNHIETMALIESQIAIDLQARGYDQETALQGAKLEAAAIENQRSRTLQENLASAQMAQDYDFHKDNLGLREEELEATRANLAERMTLDLKRFGLQEREVNALLDRQDVKDGIELASIMFEMAEGNPDMEAQAAEHMTKAFGKAQGLSQEEIDTQILNGRAEGFSNAETFTDYATKKGFSEDSISEVVKANTSVDGTWSTQKGPATTSSVTDSAKSILKLTGEEKAEKVIAVRDQLVNMTNTEVQQLIDTPKSLIDLQNAGVISKTIPKLNSKLLRVSEWDKLGLSKGDLFIREIDGVKHLILVDNFTSKKDQSLWESWRKGTLYGTNVTAGDNTVSEIWSSGWKEI